MKAKKLIWQCATISDEPVVSLDLWVTVHTLQIEKKLLLSHLSIECSPGSEKGGSDQQMMPELLNEAFSVKATRQNLENTVKNPMISRFRCIKEVAIGSRFRGNRHTDRHDYHNPTAHVPRVKYGNYY